MYFVAGATGNIGGAAAALAHQGLPARALVRDPNRANLPDGATPAIADLNDPDTRTPWLDGVEAAFMLPGHPDMPGLYARLRDAGVKRAVQLSGSSAGTGDTQNAVTAMMEDSETAARESGTPWTILRPSAFMSNTLRWLPELRAGDVVRAPWGDIALACIDAVDIDPAAVQSTQFNAEANHVQLRAALPEGAKGPYDTVLANILATPLKVLAPLLCAHVRSGGALVLVTFSPDSGNVLEAEVVRLFFAAA